MSVGNYAPCGLSPQTDGMPVILKKESNMKISHYFPNYCILHIPISSIKYIKQFSHQRYCRHPLFVPHPYILYNIENNFLVVFTAHSYFPKIKLLSVIVKINNYNFNSLKGPVLLCITINLNSSLIHKVIHFPVVYRKRTAVSLY